MRFKPILFLAIAVGLYYVARSIGPRGDAAPLNVGGISPERAKYHILALVLMLGAFGFFIAAGVSLLRGHRR